MDAEKTRQHREQYRARQRILEAYKDDYEIMLARHRLELAELQTKRDRELQVLTAQQNSPITLVNYGEVQARRQRGVREKY